MRSRRSAPACAVLKQSASARRGRCAFWAACFLTLALGPNLPAPAQPFHLPTANHALFEPGGEPRFFMGTAGKPWTTGRFGCVRSEGWQFHEGLDIRCLQRDRKGNPTDPILATADGTVTYLNRRPSLSNYGNYLVLCHLVEGIQVYSLYAHLSDIRADLAPGKPVKAGETLGVMGCTSNTRQRISKERAHLHFELNLLLHDRFSVWFKKTHPGERNDHGEWNGRNLLGLDPQALLLAQRALGASFSLLQFIRQQTELCRVSVSATNFPWLRRYSPLVRPNPKAEKEGVAGYEIALAFNGLPFELIPRPASEMGGGAGGKFRLLSVNAAERARRPCGRIVSEQAGRWTLTPRGQELLELLTF